MGILVEKRDKSEMINRLYNYLNTDIDNPSLQVDVSRHILGNIEENEKDLNALIKVICDNVNVLNEDQVRCLMKDVELNVNKINWVMAVVMKNNVWYDSKLRKSFLEYVNNTDSFLDLKDDELKENINTINDVVHSPFIDNDMNDKIVDMLYLENYKRLEYLEVLRVIKDCNLSNKLYNYLTKSISFSNREIGNMLKKIDEDNLLSLFTDKFMEMDENSDIVSMDLLIEKFNRLYEYNLVENLNSSDKLSEVMNLSLDEEYGYFYLSDFSIITKMISRNEAFISDVGLIKEILSSFDIDARVILMNKIHNEEEDFSIGKIEKIVNDEFAVKMNSFIKIKDSK